MSRTRGINWLTSLGFVALGAGYLWEAARERKGGSVLGPTGNELDGLRRGRARLGAIGNAGRVGLAPKDGVREVKLHPAGSIDNRVRFIVEQIRKDSIDKKTITEARAIVSGKCRVERGGLEWCLPAGTLVVRKPYDLVPIEQIEVGDIILGDGGWTEVLTTFDRGVQPILAFRLNNGSTLRCSPEHKLFVVPRRTRKGNVIPRGSGRRPKESFPGRREDAIEVKAKDIREDDELLQPESIPFGVEHIDADRALIMGAYIAEGWLEPSRASIAGIPESKGVREKVINAADRLGILHSEDRFKVRLRGRHISEWLSSCGELCQNKHLPTVDLDEETVKAALVGINADASFTDARKQPMPRFCTTSPMLAQQYRLLYRMLGHSATVDTEVRDGARLLYKVNIRTKGFARGGKAWAKVQKIESQPPEHTFDLETASNRIYLPECDVVVHNCVAPKDWLGELRMIYFAITNPNSPYAVRYTRDHATVDLFGSSDLMRRLPSEDCDGLAVRVGALCRAIGYAVKCRVVAPAGQPNQWAHIYIMVGDEPGNPNPRRWLALDASEPQHPPFWEVPKRLISTVKDFDV